MQVPIGYIVTIIVVLAGAVSTLFWLYIKAKDDVLKEKEEKVHILAELKRRAEEKRRKDSERREGTKHDSF